MLVCLFVPRGSCRGREDIVSVCVFVLRILFFIAGVLGVCETTPLVSVGSLCLCSGLVFVTVELLMCVVCFLSVR